MRLFFLIVYILVFYSFYGMSQGDQVEKKYSTILMINGNTPISEFTFFRKISFNYLKNESFISILDYFFDKKGEYTEIETKILEVENSKKEKYYFHSKNFRFIVKYKKNKVLLSIKNLKKMKCKKRIKLKSN